MAPVLDERGLSHRVSRPGPGNGCHLPRPLSCFAADHFSCADKCIALEAGCVPGRQPVGTWPILCIPSTPHATLPLIPPYIVQPRPSQRPQSSSHFSHFESLMLPKWKSRKSSADADSGESSMDVKEDTGYAGKKWYLGILGDKLTDEVPGMIRLLPAATI